MEKKEEEEEENGEELPPGWRSRIDPRYNRVYYFNPTTKESTWKYPGEKKKKSKKTKKKKKKEEESVVAEEKNTETIRKHEEEGKIIENHIQEKPSSNENETRPIGNEETLQETKKVEEDEEDNEEIAAQVVVQPLHRHKRTVDPDLWVRGFDDDLGRFFWFNRKTKRSVWVRPHGVPKEDDEDETNTCEQQSTTSDSNSISPKLSLPNMSISTQKAGPSPPPALLVSSPNIYSISASSPNLLNKAGSSPKLSSPGSSPSLRRGSGSGLMLLSPRSGMMMSYKRAGSSDDLGGGDRRKFYAGSPATSSSDLQNLARQYEEKKSQVNNHTSTSSSSNNNNNNNNSSVEPEILQGRKTSSLDHRELFGNDHDVLSVSSNDDDDEDLEKQHQQEATLTNMQNLIPGSRVCTPYGDGQLISTSLRSGEDHLVVLMEDEKTKAYLNPESVWSYATHKSIRHAPALGATVMTPYGIGIVIKQRLPEGLLDIRYDFGVGHLRSSDLVQLPKALKIGDYVNSPYGHGRLEEIRTRDSCLEVKLDWELANGRHATAYLQPHSIYLPEQSPMDDWHLIENEEVPNTIDDDDDNESDIHSPEEDVNESETSENDSDEIDVGPPEEEEEEEEDDESNVHNNKEDISLLEETTILSEPSEKQQAVLEVEDPSSRPLSMKEKRDAWEKAASARSNYVSPVKPAPPPTTRMRKSSSAEISPSASSSNLLGNSSESVDVPTTTPKLGNSIRALMEKLKDSSGQVPIIQVGGTLKPTISSSDITPRRRRSSSAELPTPNFLKDQEEDIIIDSQKPPSIRQTVILPPHRNPVTESTTSVTTTTTATATTNEIEKIEHVSDLVNHVMSRPSIRKGLRVSPNRVSQSFADNQDIKDALAGTITSPTTTKEFPSQADVSIDPFAFNEPAENTLFSKKDTNESIWDDAFGNTDSVASKSSWDAFASPENMSQQVVVVSDLWTPTIAPEIPKRKELVFDSEVVVNRAGNNTPEAATNITPLPPILKKSKFGSSSSMISSSPSNNSVSSPTAASAAAAATTTTTPLATSSTPGKTPPPLPQRKGTATKASDSANNQSWDSEEIAQELKKVKERRGPFRFFRSPRKQDSSEDP